MKIEKGYTPLVTVICTVYNHEKYLRDALNGFVMQKAPFKFEVLVHDDASTDHSAQIIKEYAVRYPNIIHPVLQKENRYSQGVRITSDILYPMVRGEYIALCEGDDFWTDSEKLSKQVQYMEKHPECSCTCHPVNYLRGAEVVRNDWHGEEERDFTTEEVIRGGGLFMATCSLCFRSKYIRKPLPSFFKMADIGDYPLQIYMALCGKIHYIPRIMGCYRWQHEGSWTSSMAHNRERVVKHACIEICWLDEVDRFSQGKFTKAISFHQAAMFLHPFLEKEISALRWNAIYQRLSFKDKVYFWRVIHILLLKKSIKGHFPLVYSALRKIKRSICR